MATSEVVNPQLVTPANENIVTPHREVVEALLKYHRIHDGVWGLFLRFGLGATNVSLSQEGGNIAPAAVIPILEIGLQRFENESSISVDAAKVNPRAAVAPRSDK